MSNNADVFACMLYLNFNVSYKAYLSNNADVLACMLYLNLNVSYKAYLRSWPTVLVISTGMCVTLRYDEFGRLKKEFRSGMGRSEREAAALERLHGSVGGCWRA